MDNYQILHPRHLGSFRDRVNELYLLLGNCIDAEKACGREMRQCKVFLSDIRNQYDELVHSLLYEEYLSTMATTIIEQPPLNGSKITLLLRSSDEPEHAVLHSYRLSEEEAVGLDAYEQTIRLFQRYLQYASGEDLTLSTHLLRTWIYVSDIDTNYEGVVRARNEIFARHGLTPDTHFVASTGIGGHTRERSGRVAIDFLTYPHIQERDKKYLQALTHLNPTHEYGVAFERGTRLALGDKQVCYISGTASIDDHGQVVYPNDVVRQTARLLENIGELLKDGGATMNDVKYFVVYLRDTSDNDVVNMLMERAYPHIPRVLVHAKVCRPQWLVEMECVAIRYDATPNL